MISFDTQPDRYNHWKLSFDGPVATLTLDIAEDKPLVPGYKLKLNSYDLGVDIELSDALNRIRFEHPEVKSVILTSGKSRMFCSGANIYMLGHSSHAWKVNFCKFTNETRNGIEDASANSGLKFLAALNGTTAGGGYELALAADRSYMLDVDDGPQIALSEMNFGAYPMANGRSRLETHYCGEAPSSPRNESIDTGKAREVGLVTSTPDDIDWDDEVRIAIEERASLSPDALTGMEASLRFAGPETMLTRVFGRLTAWQNWIFQRPNAVGEQGALKVYGTGARAKYDWERV
jgi:enoyl-CoA hydratase/carnithine racemase